MPRYQNSSKVSEVPKKHHSSHPQIKTWLPLAITTAGFTWAILGALFTYFNKTASVDLVEMRYKSAISYTDSRVSEAIREVEAYSDKNRLLMEKSLESQTALIKEQGRSIDNIDKWLERLSNRINEVGDQREHGHSKR